MTAYLLPVPKARFWNQAGNAPLVGGKVYTYQAGTAIPLASYTDSTGLVPNTNPVILDGSGEADIWLSGNYKIVLQDSTGTQQWSVDNVSDIGTAIANIFGQIMNIYAGTSGGTANALTLSPSPSLNSYTTGQKVRFSIFQSNTSAATVNINTLGAKNIKKFNGSGLVDLVGGDLPVNTIAEIEYDGTQFELINVRPFSQSVDVASAATLNLDTSNGIYVSVTGTTTVTAITLAQGQIRRLKAASGFVLTNGASLVCPGSQNVVLAAGDSVEVVGEASGVVRVVDITLAQNVLPLRSYLSGLTLSTAGSSATMSIAAGQATDSTNVRLMNIAAFSKTTSSWAVGSAAGGLDTGAIANSTWYHFFLIQRPDTGLVDVLISLSATAPTMPTNYTFFRRIGSGKTNGSAQWTAFTQDGDYFRLSTSVLDITAANPGTAAVTRTLASVPTGINVTALFNSAAFDTASAGYAVLFSDLAATDEAASLNSGPLFSAGPAVAANIPGGGMNQIRTNTSAQIRSRMTASAATTTLYISTFGWIDPRGKNS